MEKLGWGQDCRLGVDPPLHSPNPLFPSYALTHCSDLISPASPTLPPGKLQSACGYMNACFNRFRCAHPPHPPLFLCLSCCCSRAVPEQLFSGREALQMRWLKWPGLREKLTLKPAFSPGIRKTILTGRVVRHWGRLPSKVVDVLCLSVQEAFA